MNDSPNLTELLDAIDKTLSDDVLPNTSGATRHAVRVAANLCRIVGRELDAPDGAEVRLALAQLLDASADDDVAALLDQRLASDDPTFDASVGDLLFADVCRRADIAKPGYRNADT